MPLRHEIRRILVLHVSRSICLPYEGEASVVLSVVQQGLDDGVLLVAFLSLNGEHRREDDNATHEADNVIEERSHGPQFNSPLCSLHESSIG